MEQWATSRTIAPKERARATGKGLDKGKGKGSWRYQGCGYQGACHYCGKVEHKRSECWKYWKDHQNQIRAMHKQEEEAIEQVECQMCWMVGQVDEVVPLPEASWSRPRKLAGPKRGRCPKSGDLVQLMAMDARMYVAIISRFWTRRRTSTSMRWRRSQ